MSGNTENQERGLLFGMLFMLAGAFIVFVSLDIIPVGDEGFNAPRWVVAVVGGTFFIAGMTVSFQDYRFAEFRSSRAFAIFHYIFVGLILVCFAVVSNWIAFGPGERQFEGGVSVPGVSVSTSSGELFGRVVFGIGGVILDIITLWYFTGGLVKLFKELSENNNEE